MNFVLLLHAFENVGAFLSSYIVALLVVQPSAEFSAFLMAITLSSVAYPSTGILSLGRTMPSCA